MLSGGEEVVHARADGEAVHVLVLDVEVAPHGTFPLPADLGEPVVFRIELVRVAGAPRPIRFPDVMAERVAEELLQAAADRPLLAGERILHLTVLPAEVRVEARAVPAEPVEVEGAARLDA